MFGIIPLIPFIVGLISGLEDGLFIVSTVMSGCFLFILGILKSAVSDAKWWKSGAETLFVGAAAAGSAFLIGLAFEGIAK